MRKAGAALHPTIQRSLHILHSAAGINAGPIYATERAYPLVVIHCGAHKFEVQVRHRVLGREAKSGEKP